MIQSKSEAIRVITIFLTPELAPFLRTKHLYLSLSFYFYWLGFDTLIFMSSYRLKPSALPQTLCWNRGFLSHSSANFPSDVFLPKHDASGSKGVGDKKVLLSRARWSRLLLKVAGSLKLHNIEKTGTEQGFLSPSDHLWSWICSWVMERFPRTEPVSKPNLAPLGLKDQHDLNCLFSALVQVT